MLVLTRKCGESLILTGIEGTDAEIVLTIIETRRGVRIGIEATDNIRIFRPESCGGEEKLKQLRATIKRKNGKVVTT